MACRPAAASSCLMAIDVKIKPPAQGNRTTARGQEGAYRPPTHHLEAEQGLLGALLMDNSALEKVSDVLRPCHFYTPVYQRLYEAILKLIERGQIAVPVTLKNSVERDREL